MNRITTIIAACSICLSLLATGCNRKPTPLKEGVVWKVIWADANNRTGLYREKMPNKLSPGPAGGSYGVDMHGLLYPGHLEIQFAGTPDGHSQIIPFNQILWLEFGDGGVVAGKQ